VSRNVSYPVPIMQRARTLREAGFTLREVAARVARETGHTPSDMTVLRWTDQAWDEQEKASARARTAKRAGGRMVARSQSPEYKMARVAALRERGLSYNAIAQVMELDFGDRMRTSTVRDALEANTYPKGLR
jgi:intein-encoded DNA endonuclease-like protein